MPALDGLRGLAVAGVLLFHGDHLTGGFLGVDLFFVLSGFLITSLLLAESSENGSVGLGGFWARRARRLLPALCGLLIGVAIYCLAFADPGELARIRGDGLATLGYVANWRAIFAGQDYWAMFQSPSPFEHTWSLAIEEQFYLIWPLIFVGIFAMFRHATARALFVVSLVLAVASSLLMWALFDPNNVSRVYYGTDTRASSLLLGVALAAYLAGWGPVKSRWGRIALEAVGFAGAAVLAVAWIRVGGQNPWLYKGGFLICGLSVIAVIAAASHPEAGPLSKILSFKPICLLGLISYGVYLWHWPIYIVLDADRTGLDGWALFALRVGVTLIISVASFVIIESPIRRGALPARQWRVLTPVVAVGLVLVILGVTAAAATAPSAAVSTVAHPRQVVPSSANPVLLVGDSVGMTVIPGLEKAGFTVVHGARPGTRLVRGTMDFSPQLPFGRWPVRWASYVRTYNPKVAVRHLGRLGSLQRDSAPPDQGARAPDAGVGQVLRGRDPPGGQVAERAGRACGDPDHPLLRDPRPPGPAQQHRHVVLQPGPGRPCEQAAEGARRRARRQALGSRPQPAALTGREVPHVAARHRSGAVRRRPFHPAGIELDR